MAGRVSEEAREFDRGYNRSLMQEESTNREQITIARRVLRDVIATELTPRQRQAILLYYYDGLGKSEIARQMGVNPSTVTRTLSRGEETIRRFLRFFFEKRRVFSSEE